MPLPGPNQPGVIAGWPEMFPAILMGWGGVGQVPIAPPLAAVARAVSHAIGVGMQKLSVNPDAILEALWDPDK